MLTHSVSGSIISLPLTHSGDGSRTPQLGQYRPLLSVVFLCPFKSNTVLHRVKSFMVGCIEQSLIGLAVPFCGSANLIQSTAQDFVLNGSGLFPQKRHKSMNTQNPSNQSVSEIQNKLLDISHTIGALNDCNCHFMQVLAQHLQRTGKQVEQLTVAELIAIINRVTQSYNNEVSK